jgi:predicted ATPase
MTTFSTLKLDNWRQFDHIAIDLRSQTTVLTGPNGCGKTTILNILSKHFGWNINFTATPYNNKKNEKIFSDFQHIKESELNNAQTNSVQIGEIVYNDSTSCNILAPIISPNPQYQMSLMLYGNHMVGMQKAVRGIHIPSHRPATTFQQIDQIPTNPKTKQQQSQNFQQLLLQTYGSTNVKNPGIVLKESLISMALFGYGNEAVSENRGLMDLYESFQEKLRILLPSSIGFQKLEVRMPDVVLVTDTGEFTLDSMSGGVNSIFAMTWQIHMYGEEGEDCTVIIDEPENHLHPSMQRALLPNLAAAFPDYHFIVATHSPFIVTSNPEAKIYALLYDQNQKVVSREIESSSLAASPEEVLREILDMPSTLPIWVERKISEVLTKHESNPDEKEKVAAIYKDLQDAKVASFLKDYHVKN